MPQPPGAAPYEAIPYPGEPFAQTHPDRLATLAALFGVRAAPPAACRVLELGCGDGGNLLPMALALPGATFVGIDTSASAIARGRETAAALGLRNVELAEAGIEDFRAAAGSFDYVIAHGVFSWVPEPVRDALLALCRHVLAERGIAYVSYNALPGARVPMTLRELLALHVEGIDDPSERIATARRLLALLAGDNERATLLGPEAASLLNQPDSFLFHDALAPVNQPFFFHEFAALAGAHGLQYLAEANFLEMQADWVPADLREELFAGRDVLRQEQLLDLLKARRFRQTLLCPAEVRLERELTLDRVTGFAVSSPARAFAEDPEHPGRVTFVAPGGSRLTAEHELVVAALLRVSSSWPAAVWARELAGDEDSQEAQAILANALLRCLAANVLQFHVHPPDVATRPGERPRASPLARRQARRQANVTNQRHTRVVLEEERVRRVLTLLDGTRDRRALLAEVDGASQEWLEGCLEHLARAALLVA